MGNIYRLIPVCSSLNTIKKNHPILNQIYNIITELQAQDKRYLHTWELKEKNRLSSKTNKKYARYDHNKTTLFRLLLDHQES